MLVSHTTVSIDKYIAEVDLYIGKGGVITTDRNQSIRLLARAGGEVSKSIYEQCLALMKEPVKVDEVEVEVQPAKKVSHKKGASKK